jgi:hypothetical protein
MDKNLTRLIERNPELERRAGVTLGGLYAGLDENGFLTGNYEIRAMDGKMLEQNVRFAISAINDSGQIAAAAHFTCEASSFLGQLTESTLLQVEGVLIAKIRIYPDAIG